MHPDERLIVLADARAAPPAPIVTETYARLSGGGSRWTLWEVRLPVESVANVTAWLERLGHVLVPRPSSVDLATPPRARGEHGEAVFWIGDAPVVALEAPQSDGEALVCFKTGTDSFSASVEAAESERVRGDQVV